MRARLNILAAAAVTASVLGDVLADIASVVVETVTGGGSRLGSPGGGSGLVGGESAVAGSSCDDCQLGNARRIAEMLGRTGRGVVPASHVGGRWKECGV